MSDTEFQQKYGYYEDPIFVWDTVGDVVETNMGWVYDEQYEEMSEEDW